MKFIIDHVSKSSGRLGHLVQHETGKQFRTPLLMQTTKGGSIPYLSNAVFSYVSEDAQVLQLSLATMDQMAESLKLFKGGGLSAYIGYKGYPTMLMVRDPCETMPSGSNDRDVVPLFTRRGKEMLSAEKYMDLIEAFAPDIYQGLSDCDTNLQSSKKRVQKSVDRTETVMDYCFERQLKSSKLQNSILFAPIVGGFNTFARTQCIQHCKLKGASSVGGYLLEGFHSYGLSATELSAHDLLPTLVHCIQGLDSDKPKMLPGAYTPLVMLESIRSGVDVFDTSYAYCAAVNFKALSFDFILNRDTKTLEETPFIDVTIESLKEDFKPLLSYCKCLACTKHTRAYLQHLYKTKELLGPILLMIHNLHHLMNFFEVIRTCISNDTLSDLIHLIKHQTSDEHINYCIAELPPKTKKDKNVSIPKENFVLS